MIYFVGADLKMHWAAERRAQQRLKCVHSNREAAGLHPSPYAVQASCCSAKVPSPAMATARPVRRSARTVRVIGFFCARPSHSAFAGRQTIFCMVLYSSPVLYGLHGARVKPGEQSHVRPEPVHPGARQAHRESGGGHVQIPRRRRVEFAACGFTELRGTLSTTPLDLRSPLPSPTLFGVRIVQISNKFIY